MSTEPTHYVITAVQYRALVDNESLQNNWPTLHASLDQAEAVEFRIIDGNTFAIEEDDVECWVEVES